MSPYLTLFRDLHSFPESKCPYENVLAHLIHEKDHFKYLITAFAAFTPFAWIKKNMISRRRHNTNSQLKRDLHLNNAVLSGGSSIEWSYPKAEDSACNTSMKPSSTSHTTIFNLYTIKCNIVLSIWLKKLNVQNLDSIIPSRTGRSIN